MGQDSKIIIWERVENDDDTEYKKAIVKSEIHELGIYDIEYVKLNNREFVITV